MYHHSRGNFRLFRGQRPRGGRRQKFINPSLFVRKAEQNIVQQEYEAQFKFSDFSIHEQIKANIERKGFATPTPIQDQVIPLALQGKDVIGIANTGTGKTAAFLIPLINKVLGNRGEKVLIVAPTRELAFQIQDDFRNLSLNTKLASVLVIGGASMFVQFRQLERNHHFLIGTPGRIKDLVQRGKIHLSMYRSLVLDEVDRMLDMGFINDIRFFVEKMPIERQTLFFSATIANQMLPLMNSFLKDPVRISVKVQETVGLVDQDIIRVNGRNKTELLHEILRQEMFEKVLVFGRTKRGVEKLSELLVAKGHRAAAIHGNKSQGQRQRALDLFRRGEVRILLATDVASRGLDINNVSHVINFDQPETYEDYIHRIGRTGRANKKGSALTFID
jgi:superfamily II DNA/RNA helicase